MPKIPMVERQGVLATGGLGPRANVGAFTAPGQALTGLGKTASDIQYRFHMAEKEAETEKAQQEIATSTNQNFNNFTNASEATTVQQYQDDAEAYKKKLRQENLEPLRKKLTKRQFQKVESEFNKTVAAKVATGSQVAFAKHQRIRADQVNTTIEDTMSQMRGLDPSSSLYQQLQQNLDDGFDRWSAQGLNLKYNKGGYRRELSASAFENQIQSADTQADIDRMRGRLAAERPDMTAKQFALRDAAITAQEKIVDDRQVQAAFDQIVNENQGTFSNPQEIDKAVEMIRTGKTIDIENNAGELISVDFKTMKASNRELLISKIKARANSEKAETLDANMKLANTKIQRKSLAELQELQEQMTKATDGSDWTPGSKHMHFPDVQDFNDRQKVLTLINTRIRNLAVDAQAEAGQALRDASAAIANSPDGSVADETVDQVNAAVEKLRLADRPDEANKVETNFAATIAAGKDFASVEFLTVAEQTAYIEEVKAGRATEEGELRYQKLEKRLAARNKDMADDFVGYYNKKRPNEPKTPSELINLQLQMGISPTNVRVTSDDDLTKFTADYNRDGITASEKAVVLENFVKSFGADHENRVMRHLMTTKTISFAEHLQMTNPTNTTMAKLVEGNTEANISNFEKKVSLTDRQEIDAIVAERLVDYSSSIAGGIRDGIIGIGGDDKRTGHIIQLQDAVANAAKHLKATPQGTTLSADEAVDLFIDATIGSKYVFEDINGSKMRLPIELKGQAKDISSVLQHSAFSDRDYLKSRIIFPPTPPGQSDEDFQNEYLRDLARTGSWRTTVDNEGVFLVDQIGNLVPMKPSEDFDPLPSMDGFSGFVSVSFDSVLPLAQEFNETPGNRMSVLQKMFANQKLF